MLEQRIQANSGSLAGIPDDHKPLIAKLVHERCVPEIIRREQVGLTIYDPSISISSAIKDFRHYLDTFSKSSCPHKTKTMRKLVKLWLKRFL